MNFLQPPVLYNSAGELRRVGFELEYSGITLEKSARLVQQVTGGTIRQQGDFDYRISGTPYGEFKLELDSRLIKDQLYLDFLKGLGFRIDHPELFTPLQELLARIGDYFVPFELITPPLPLDQLDVMEQLRCKLQEHGAEGTAQSVLYAFGLHLNIEILEPDHRMVLRYLQAFLLLSGWLYEQAQVNRSRKLTMFIKDFPASYRDLVLDPAYQPAQEQLFADYLAANPSRNRVLDLLPLFASMSDDLAAEYRNKQVQPRPAFHYRLPNSLVSNPDWSIATEWELWLWVERLAADRKGLERLLFRYRKLRRGFIFRFAKKWQREVHGWLKSAENR